MILLEGGCKERALNISPKLKLLPLPGHRNNDDVQTVAQLGIEHPDVYAHTRPQRIFFSQ